MSCKIVILYCNNISTSEKSKPGKSDSCQPWEKVLLDEVYSSWKKSLLIISAESMRHHHAYFGKKNESGLPENAFCL